MTYTIRNQRAEMRRLRQTEHLTLSEIGDTAGAPAMRGQMAIFDFRRG
jgi:hypothetical protein